MENKNPHMADLLKDTLKQTVERNMQRVIPIPEKEEEVQFQFWLPKELLRDLKLLAVKRDTSAKRILVDLLQDYMDMKTIRDIESDSNYDPKKVTIAELARAMSFVKKHEHLLDDNNDQ